MLYQKYNVLTVFFIGIKELCTALADNRRQFNTGCQPWCSTRQDRGTKRVSESLDGMRGRDAVCKKVDSQGEHFTGIHDRFLRDPVYRESQLAIGWTEQKCKEWDELAKEDNTYKLTPEEKKRYQG